MNLTSGEIVAIIMAQGTLVSVITAGLTSWWVNKKKVPAEIIESSARARLSNGELAEKYLGIATKQADENLELNSQLKVKEQEKTELKSELDKIKIDLLAIDNRYKREIEEVKADLNGRMDELQKENENLRDWANRLVLQLKSFRITPTPYDIEEAKKKGLSLGDLGTCLSEEEKRNATKQNKK